MKVFSIMGVVAIFIVWACDSNTDDGDIADGGSHEHTDADSDTDADADTDTDADSDGDVDSDTDTDADTDTDVDTDSDADKDTAGDADVSCDYTCIASSLCMQGGREMPGYCEGPFAICCDLSPTDGDADSDSDGDTDTDTDSDVDGDSDTDTVTDALFYLSDLCERDDAENAWGPMEKDLSNGEEAFGDGGPLIIAGSVYTKGLGVHAPSDVAYDLAGKCTAFLAEVGIDEEMKSVGSVIFQVWGDGELLFESDTRYGDDDPAPVTVDIRGVSTLRLVTDPGDGNDSDHADWGDARVECENATFTVCRAPETEIPAPAGYHLAWSDEFDVEGRPNADNWGYEHGYVRNGEWQYYQEDNAFVQAGFLIIQGRREQAPDGDYTSTSLRTMNDNWTPKQRFLYGRIEMHARIVTEPGLWPAFWTLGAGGGDWPWNGEIDIMEYYNDAIHANFCVAADTQWQGRWDSVSQSMASFGDADWDAKFHTWRMDWDENEIRLFLDDEEMNQAYQDDLLNPDGSAPFRNPQYILVNLAIGGDGRPDPSNTYFPNHYVVDYVRVYQRN